MLWEKPNAAARLAATYCARIAAHFRAPLTMADHAASLNVTPTHLTRACKAATGRTAADLLTERVLYEARSLLTSTDAPAQDIARFLGFGSAAYFTRFMQHHCDRTPTQMRRDARHAKSALLTKLPPDPANDSLRPARGRKKTTTRRKHPLTRRKNYCLMRAINK